MEPYITTEGPHPLPIRRRSYYVATMYNPGMGIWRTFRPSSLNDRRARSLSWLMLAAILPALFFVGHSLQADSSHAHVGDVASQDRDQEQEHARHCHGAMANCADRPLTAGPGQLLVSDTLLPVVTFGTLPIITLSLTPQTHISLPGDPPPESAV